MVSSGIITQDVLSILHNLSNAASSGLLTQQALEILYNEPEIVTYALVTQSLVQAAYTVTKPSGIVTQDILSVLHSIDQSSGLMTQQALEILYIEAVPAGPPSGFITQDILSVLHSIDQSSGLVTQQAIEVLYLPSEFLNTQARVTQQIVQVAVGTGVIPLLQSGVFTQDSIGILQDFQSAGRFTQNFAEILYSSETGIPAFMTQDSVGVLQSISSPSGRFTQDFLEILYSEAQGIGRTTQDSIGVLQKVETSGRFTQNFVEVLYTPSAGERFTQESVGVLQSVGSISGRFTQNFIEVLYQDIGHAAFMTQDSVSVLQKINTSGRFTQNFVEVLYQEPPSLNIQFDFPIEKLQEISSVNPAIFLMEANLNGTDYTVEARNNTADDVPLLEASPVFEDYFSIKGGNRFDEINIDLTTTGDWDGAIDWQYWRDDSTYVTIPHLVDNTSGFRQNGLVYWPNLMDMGKLEDGSYEARARVSVFTSLTTQPLARRIDLSTNIGARGQFPIESAFTHETKTIAVDCKECSIDCCSVCCCQCSPPSGGFQYFRMTFSDCLSRTVLSDPLTPFSSTGLVLTGRMDPTGLPGSRADCYSRLGLEFEEQTIPETVFVWSGDICGYTDAIDCWKITWGCNIDNEEAIPDTEATGCENYQLLIDVLKCSGSIFTSCDNGDNLSNVDFAGPIGGSSGLITTNLGFLSGCSCEFGIAVYTGIVFNDYRCRCCDQEGGVGTVSVEIDSVEFP